MYLDKADEIIYTTELIKLYDELNMDYVPTFSRDNFYRGMKQGIDQGRGDGISAGERAILLQLLESKFTKIPDNYMNIIQLANSHELLIYAQRVLDSDNIVDVFKN